jgi:hypothetical protein
MPVPNVFGSATTSIPLSQLDQNFNTTATLGNAAIGLGNVTTTVGNLTLTNVNITSGTINAAVTQSGFAGNAVIYSNTSGNLTGNASVFSVDSSGNVGLGIASPTARLQIAGTTASTTTLINATTGATFTNYRNTGQDFYVGLDNSAGGSFGTAYSANLYGSGAYPMVFWTNGTERMRISSAGDVAIGTTTTAFDTGSGLRIQRDNAPATIRLVQNGTGGSAFELSAASGNAQLDYRTGDLKFLSAGTEVMRVTSVGNIGMGTTTPQARLVVSNLGNNGYEIDPNGGFFTTYNRTTSVFTKNTLRASAYTFNINNSNDAVNIDSSGNLLVGTSNSVPSSTVSGVRICNPSTDTSRWSCGSTTSTVTHIQFLNGNGVVGNIQTSGSATSYVTSSDYRLKENIAPMTDALAKIALLKPVTYKWKVDGSDGQGFIAHELQAIVPDCVTGEKDAVDTEGKPVYQGIDTSFLVATLTAAIQEQQTLITNLTTRLSALENK